MNVTVNESARGTKYLSSSGSSKPIPSKLYDKLIDDFDLELVPNDDEFPLPWDADFEVKGSNLVLSGHASDGGYGTSVTTIPLRDATRWVSIVLHVPEYHDDRDSEVQDTLDQLTNLGWTIK